MPYLIDGHNLIPKIRGLALGEVDDELQLIELLQEYCRRQRKEAEVFFDNAPAGQPRARNYGLLVARFIREGVTADEAIRAKLSRLGKEARNWTVVSSDREVQSSARAARAQVLPSETFAQMLMQALSEDRKAPADHSDRMSEQELDEWLKLFGGHKPKPPF